MSIYSFGFAPSPIAGPLKVYQRGRLVGTVPAYPVTSTSLIFDVRPSDFTLETRDGEQVLIAAPMIGPGDFDCIAGFIHADGTPARKGEAAAMFDALAAVTKFGR